MKLFGLLNKVSLSALVDEMEYLEVPHGTLMCKENSYGDEFFVVLNGAVDISITELGKVASLGAGSTFGELALSKNTPREASVRATTNRIRTELAVVTKSTFEAYVRPVMAVEIDFAQSGYNQDRSKAYRNQKDNNGGQVSGVRDVKKTRLARWLKKVYHMVCFFVRSNKLFFRHKVRLLWRDLWLSQRSVTYCLALMVSRHLTHFAVLFCLSQDNNSQLL